MKELRYTLLSDGSSDRALIPLQPAVRRAAGNLHGRTVLQLPVNTQVEQLPDPKSILYKLLRDASELKGRRLKNFPVRERAQRVAELINNFEPLRNLTAFRALEAEIKQVSQALV